MGEPSFLSILLWIVAGIFAIFAIFAASPVGKGIPQRWQGVATFAFITLLFVGFGYLATKPAKATPEERAAAEQRREERERQDLVAGIASFPARAAAVCDRLEQVSQRDVSDMEVAVSTVRLFREAALLIGSVEQAEEQPIPVPAEVVAAQEALRVALVRKQRQLFPEMRRTYAAYMSGSVSGLQANFRAVGPGGRTLRAASPHFSSRDAVMQAHQTILIQATQFRFDRAEYVYSLTGAYDYFTVRGRADDELD